jgi:cardiolipin synthase
MKATMARTKGHKRRGAGCVTDPQAIAPLRQLGSQALSRASGAPLVAGNLVRILKDAEGNFPVWLAAIRAAKRSVYLENYIFEEDEVGIAFADALAAKARTGVRVHLIRDWLGTLRGASRSFWRHLAQAGVDIRTFNPPRLSSPIGWVSRDHRKAIVVDGEVAFVSGLCISQRWKGNPARGIPPWRDTGLEIRGPAVGDVTRAFAQVWETMGDPLPPDDLSSRDPDPLEGGVALRVVAGSPSTAGLMRMDQLIAAVARRSLWLTDAYFVGMTTYVQALRAAARDGVDVRLLVPNTTDLLVVRSISRAGYRPLMEAGVRIFEWNGSMLHAKTAVADGRWTRIGSSNLNVASFLSNYELDVAIEDEGVAKEMEEMYLADLQNATEIELERNRIVQRPGSSHAAGAPATAARKRLRSGAPLGRGSSGRAAAGAIRVANAVGAAVTNHRTIGPAEGRMLLLSGIVLSVLAAVSTVWPRLVAVPFGILALWIGLSLVWRSRHLAKRPTDPKDAIAVTTSGHDRSNAHKLT